MSTRRQRRRRHRHRRRAVIAWAACGALAVGATASALWHSWGGGPPDSGPTAAAPAETLRFPTPTTTVSGTPGWALFADAVAQNTPATQPGHFVVIRAAHRSTGRAYPLAGSQDRLTGEVFDDALIWRETYIPHERQGLWIMRSSKPTRFDGDAITSAPAAGALRVTERVDVLARAAGASPKDVVVDAGTYVAAVDGASGDAAALLAGVRVVAGAGARDAQVAFLVGALGCRCQVGEGAAAVFRALEVVAPDAAWEQVTDELGRGVHRTTLRYATPWGGDVEAGVDVLAATGEVAGVATRHKSSAGAYSDRLWLSTTVVDTAP